MQLFTALLHICVGGGGGCWEVEADIIRNIPAYEDKSNTHRLFFILLLYKLKVWQDMHAVNAAIGPKIQQHHPSF